MHTDDHLSVLVGANVRRLRLGAGMTVMQASARGGLNPRSWQRVEAGANVEMRCLAKVCVGLGVDVTVLLEEPPARRASRSSRSRKASASGARTR